MRRRGAGFTTRRLVAALFGSLLVCVTVAAASSLPISAARLTTFSRTYGSPTTCTLTADADAYVREDAPATSFGGETTLKVDPNAGQRHRSLVRFDLAACSPAIPADAVVHSALLRLTVVTVVLTGSRTYDLSRVSASWSEATVTWDGQPPVASPTGSVAVAPGTASGSTIQWSVVSDVQDIVTGASANHGWRVNDAAEGVPQSELLQVSSREAATGLPALVITYVG
jgi:hypothetical protein